MIIYCPRNGAQECADSGHPDPGDENNRIVPPLYNPVKNI